METLTFSTQNYNQNTFKIEFGEKFDKFPNRVQSQQKYKNKHRTGNIKREMDETDLDEKESDEYVTVPKDRVNVKPGNENQNEKIVNKTKIVDQNELSTEKEKGEKSKKKKKWRKVPLTELGFNISLFPRPVVCSGIDQEHVNLDLFNKIEEECDRLENITETHGNLIDLEGNTQRCKKYIRADRDRKVMKVHKQVKTKQCNNVLNNKGRKAIYINHRVYKMMELDIHRLCYMPSLKRAKNIVKRDVAKGKNNCLINPITNKPHLNNTAYRPTPVQCLAHAIHKDNLPSDFDTAVANLLMNIQHRDLTPEDYELLLRLDERVAPKTLSENKLNTFKTETIENNDDLEVCPICMELYEMGQVRKYLPCQHAFHSSCIDAWLKNSSMNCPIDNLPIDS